jgi:hypothetical protein
MGWNTEKEKCVRSWTDRYVGRFCRLLLHHRISFRVGRVTRLTHDVRLTPLFQDVIRFDNGVPPLLGDERFCQSLLRSLIGDSRRPPLMYEREVLEVDLKHKQFYVEHSNGKLANRLLE